uniref:Uncharacterized protein n=1 Tax=Streptomyces sp. F2 TaxID=317660 RepID=V9Z5H2_9ACTN|nr:hypothetical protein pFRL4_100 [Streptomyces sp. F2]
MTESTIQASVRSRSVHTLAPRHPWLTHGTTPLLRLGARHWPCAVAVGSPGPGLACISRAGEAR